MSGSSDEEDISNGNRDGYQGGGSDGDDDEDEEEEAAFWFWKEVGTSSIHKS